ncbi:MAG: hypothetical protein H6736_10665 [Alphaproteobacteria bacterium]|nr:hypothetical protein [Alphaproteobacteria bacterium]
MRWLPLLALSACSTPWIETDGGDWRTLLATMESNGSGNIRVSIEPEPDETSFLASFEPLDPERLSHLRFLQVEDSIPYRATDETADSNPYNRSSAAFLSSSTTVNWPIQTTDGALEGRTHKLTVGIADTTRAYRQGTARVGVMLKSDPDPASGLLRVNLIFGGALVDDEALYAATEDAIQVWRDIYASAGIQLDVVLFQAPYSTLAGPGQGDAPQWREIAESTRFGAVNVVLVEEIGGQPGAFGLAGGIPGPLAYTGQSAVAINAVLTAGADGVFDRQESRLLGESMAHEVGHFLGLYHPVEKTFERWDGLDDTPVCEAELPCVEALGDNLMFPYPIGCNSEIGCLPQERISVEQAEVMNRYTGVL